MTEDTESMILRLLREYRSDFDEIRNRLNDHTRRFDILERRMEEVHETLYTAAGIAAHANVRHDHVARELEDIKARLKRLEERA